MNTSSVCSRGTKQTNRDRALSTHFLIFFFLYLFTLNLNGAFYVINLHSCDSHLRFKDGLLAVLVSFDTKVHDHFLYVT